MRGGGLLRDLLMLVGVVGLLATLCGCTYDNDESMMFETPKLKDWLAEHGITSHFASVGRPQANGQVEAFNKIISEGMKKKLDEAKGLWADELPNVLWSICTTAKNSTGETPFLLAYGA
ncbi:uncharacterized protein [Spinacia oleracea]|uniref:Integrase catalytic domain-containing protein n=1 Tax=Spinacia oleracea TaxID=3562 RepID=A0A9R0I9C6_SPIOL|nr:uncharacterized protein LOC110783827 [Spinacia oleracea]